MKTPSPPETKSRGLEVQFPSQGWKQLLATRGPMLSAYDKARTDSEAERVQTHHGNVAEAQCRKWLEDFLPKRYGVTSGFIVSPAFRSTDKLTHFDVIIYDKLNSPILFTKSSLDDSTQGVKPALPAEFVRCVLEVKAKFNNQTVTQAIDHLDKLAPLVSGEDAPDEQYKIHLPRNFVCGLVFFELLKTQRFQEEALSKTAEILKYHGILGGLILRGQGQQLDVSGRISFHGADEAMLENLPLPAKLSLLNWAWSRSIEVNGTHAFAQIEWQESNFSRFAFDLIALLQGTFRPGFISSFYGMGSTEWDKTHQRKKRTKRKK